jgi:hypothetical protein
VVCQRRLARVQTGIKSSSCENNKYSPAMK